MERFFSKIRTYTQLSDEAENAWKDLIREQWYKRGEVFLASGDFPRKVAFVLEGLFCQYHKDREDNTVITDFFQENRMAASYSAMLAQAPNPFTIEALEPTHAIEFDFFQFKRLTIRFPEIGDFYMRYIEQHYIPEKESAESVFRFATARERYRAFVRLFPGLNMRLKKRHIAAFLGVTASRLAMLFQS